MLVVHAASALASFELVLAACQSDGKVYRFDGTTGAYLGNFGPSNASTWSVVADQPRNLAYLSSLGRIMKYNYNTGELVGSINYFMGSDLWGAINSAGTEYYAPKFGGVDFINTSTGAVSTLAISNFQARSVTTIGTNLIMVFGVQSGQILANTYNTTTKTLVDSAQLGAGSFALQSAIVGGTNTVAVHVVDGDGITEVSRVGFNSGGLITGTATQPIATYYTLLGEGGWGMARAHSGVWTIGSSVSGSVTDPQLRRYVLGSSLVEESRYDLTQKKVFTSLATVLAPEPGTMLALGAGVLAMLRRRKR